MNPPDHPPTETILQKAARLEAEIEERQAQLRAMENEKNTEIFLGGLCALHVHGAWLDVDAFNHQCITGELMASETKNDGYDLQKHFDLHDYHCGIDIDIPGLGRATVRADDGTLTLGVYLDKPEAPLAFAAKAWLEKHNVRLRTTQVHRQRRSILSRLDDNSALLRALGENVS